MSLGKAASKQRKMRHWYVFDVRLEIELFCHALINTAFWLVAIKKTTTTTFVFFTDVLPTTLHIDMFVHNRFFGPVFIWMHTRKPEKMFKQNIKSVWTSNAICLDMVGSYYAIRCSVKLFIWDSWNFFSQTWVNSVRNAWERGILAMFRGRFLSFRKIHTKITTTDEITAGAYSNLNIDRFQFGICLFFDLTMFPVFIILKILHQDKSASCLKRIVFKDSLEPFFFSTKAQCLVDRYGNLSRLTKGAHEG